MAPSCSFVFIHINKTGGTSIGHALGLRKQHLTAREVIESIGRRRWQQVFRFAIVRNPWDKVFSQYKHRVKTNQTGLGDHPIPFLKWVEATYGPEKDKQYYDNPKMFLPQSQWLCDRDGSINLDVIGRFEQLPSAFAEITGRLGIRSPLPHLNQGSEGSFRAAYDDHAAALVADWFRDDILRFGYKFDSSHTANAASSIRRPAESSGVTANL